MGRCSFWSYMNGLRLNNVLCDMEIVIHGKRSAVKLAHKVIVCYYSKYFKNMLSENRKMKTNYKRYTLANTITEAGINDVLDFMYGCIDYSTLMDNPEAKIAATFLQVTPPCINSCCSDTCCNMNAQETLVDTEVSIKHKLEQTEKCLTETDNIVSEIGVYLTETGIISTETGINSTEINFNESDFKLRDTGLNSTENYISMPNKTDIKVCKNRTNSTEAVFVGKDETRTNITESSIITDKTVLENVPHNRSENERTKDGMNNKYCENFENRPKSQVDQCMNDTETGLKSSKVSLVDTTSVTVQNSLDLTDKDLEKDTTACTTSNLESVHLENTPIVYIEVEIDATEESDQQLNDKQILNTAKVITIPNVKNQTSRETNTTKNTPATGESAEQLVNSQIIQHKGSGLVNYSEQQISLGDSLFQSESEMCNIVSTSEVNQEYGNRTRKSNQGNITIKLNRTRKSIQECGNRTRKASVKRDRQNPGEDEVDELELNMLSEKHTETVDNNQVFETSVLANNTISENNRMLIETVSEEDSALVKKELTETAMCSDDKVLYHLASKNVVEQGLESTVSMDKGSNLTPINKEVSIAGMNIAGANIEDSKYCGANIEDSKNTNNCDNTNAATRDSQNDKAISEDKVKSPKRHRKPVKRFIEETAPIGKTKTTSMISEHGSRQRMNSDMYKDREAEQLIENRKRKYVHNHFKGEQHTHNDSKQRRKGSRNIAQVIENDSEIREPKTLVIFQSAALKTSHMSPEKVTKTAPGYQDNLTKTDELYITERKVETLNDRESKEHAENEDRTNTCSIDSEIGKIDDSSLDVKCEEGQLKSTTVTEKSNMIDVYNCESCSEICDSEISLRLHMKKMHNQKMTLMCDVCGKRFNHQSSLVKHVITHVSPSNRKRDYGCILCEKKYYDRHSLRAHIRAVHTSERKYKCDMCLSAFKHKRTLHNHRESQHAEDKQRYKCFICSRTFSCELYLKRHMKIHKGERYKCSECELSFRCRLTRKRHEAAVHTNERYYCEVCGAEFKTSDDVSQHVYSVHTKQKTEQPHQTCPVCGKAVKKLQQHLETHKETQTAKSEFKCPVCVPDKTFTVQRYLKQHMKTHDDVKRFKCPNCNATFNFKYALKKHSEKCKVNVVVRVQENKIPTKVKQTELNHESSNNSSIKNSSGKSVNKLETWNNQDSPKIIRLRKIKRENIVEFVEGSPKKDSLDTSTFTEAVTSLGERVIVQHSFLECNT